MDGDSFIARVLFTPKLQQRDSDKILFPKKKLTCVRPRGELRRPVLIEPPVLPVDNTRRDTLFFRCGVSGPGFPCARQPSLRSPRSPTFPTRAPRGTACPRGRSRTGDLAHLLVRRYGGAPRPGQPGGGAGWMGSAGTAPAECPDTSGPPGRQAPRSRGRHRGTDRGNVWWRGWRARSPHQRPQGRHVPGSWPHGRDRWRRGSVRGRHHRRDPLAQQRPGRSGRAPTCPTRRIPTAPRLACVLREGPGDRAASLLCPPTPPSGTTTHVTPRARAPWSARWKTR